MFSIVEHSNNRPSEAMVIDTQTPFQVKDLLGPLNEVESRHAPEAIFICGRRDLLRRRPRIAIIGSRVASNAGLKMAADIAHTVVENGGVVVSGLAKGIDAASHLAAIEAEGDTIAVIGTPLSKSYPKENAYLQKQLMRDHLVVSQFPENQPTGKKSFVMRNRTMALLSHGSVIVEAGETSGTQHQGWEALRLGRPLFLPQSLVEANFEWPAKMVSYGAFVYRDLTELKALIDEILPAVRIFKEPAIELHF